MGDKELDKLMEKIRELESKVDHAQSKREQPASNPVSGAWKWVAGLVGAGVIALGAALVMWKLNKKNKELAKLRTKAELQELNAASASHQASMTPFLGRAARLREEAAMHRAEADELRTELAEEGQRAAEALKRVKAVRGWDALDAHNEEGR